MRFFIGAVLMLVSTAVLGEGSSKGYGQGGWFEKFDPIVAQYNASGEMFRIAGHCQSACTLFLGIRNVCIERSARLLFHAGHNRNREIAARPTQHLLAAYNGALRNYLNAGGYMNTLSFHTISGADMIRKFGYRECGK